MIIKAWTEVPGRAYELANVFRPDAKFIILGHTHYPGAWRIAERVVINTGSFVPYFGAYAAIIEAGRIEVRRIIYRQQQFVLGRLLNTFSINPH
jgi:predicted phosphodiesterase